MLDFPTWDDFTQELQRGYTHVGISFIVPNILKARRMAEYIRENHPAITIILGGYGTIIPDIQHMLPFDELCRGEGVRWLREYFGDDPAGPIHHPHIAGPAYQRIYGYAVKPHGAVLLPGVGCENACTFCVTSHNFNKQYVPLLHTGKQMFDASLRAEALVKSDEYGGHFSRVYWRQGRPPLIKRRGVGSPCVTGDAGRVPGPPRLKEGTDQIAGTVRRFDRCPRGEQRRVPGILDHGRELPQTSHPGP